MTDKTYENKEIEASVLVLTYNPDPEKLLWTIDSIIKQQGVDFEIVIADDGSKKKDFQSLRKYFDSKDFKSYTIVENKVNQGTVKNYYSGLLKCRGKYIKAISPGDMFVNEHMLRKLIDCLEKQKLDFVFTDVISYRKVAGKISPVKTKAHPNNKKAYWNGTLNDRRWQYLVLEDIAVGAAMLSKREITKKYIEEILGKVIYAEDNIWRIMFFDGVPGNCAPFESVYYEYGDGVSSTTESKWERLLTDDWNAATKIMLERKTDDPFQKKLKRNLKIVYGDNDLRKMFVKGFLANKLRSKEYTKI